MTVYLDLETLDFFADDHIKALPRDQQLHAMRFGVAVTYRDDTDDWFEWTPDLLPELWEYLTTDVVGGWNIELFDLPVIRHNLKNTGIDVEEHEVYCEDLFQTIKEKTGRWYKLETVAQANLGRGKSADGQQAALWLRDWHENGNQEALRQALDYCRLDVELERDLYRHLETFGHLLLPKRTERQELNDLLFKRDGTVERLVGEDGVLSTR